MTSLHTLPEELLIQILCSKSLDLRDLLRCSQVSKRLHTTITGTLELRYICELHKSGLEDETASWPSRLPVPSILDRLERLKDHRRAWAQLRVRDRHNIPVYSDMPGYDPGSTYEVIGGVYARGARLHGAWGLTHVLTFVILPSVVTGRRTSYWTVDLGTAIYDFGIDPDQDLLVYIEVKPELDHSPLSFPIHFRTMRTNASHPDSLLPRIEYTIPKLDVGMQGTQNAPTPRYDFIIHICDAQVGVLFRPRHPGYAPRIIVWNWHTGKVTFSFTSPLSSEISSFCFLSPSSLIIISNPESSANFSIDVRLINPSQPSTSPLVAAFIPPSFQEAVRRYLIVLRSGPLCVPWSRRTRCTATPIIADDLFRPSTKSHILSLYIDCVYEIWVPVAPHRLVESRRYLLFVDSDTFLSTVPASFEPQQPPLVVPWSDWAAKARFLDITADQRNAYVCHTHDYRFVRWGPALSFLGEDVVPQDDDDAPPRSLQVLEFGPELRDPFFSEFEAGQRMASEDDAMDDYMSSVVRDSSTIVAGPVFTHDIVSSLPYRVTTTKSYGFEIYDGLLIDSERVIGMQDLIPLQAMENEPEVLDVFVF